MASRYEQLAAIVEAQAPMTVRQVFYQAVVRGFVDKSDGGYNIVQRAVVDLRKMGAISWEDITDHTRWMRKPQTYTGLEHAVWVTATTYRRILAPAMDAHVEVWIEKEALIGVIDDICAEYDVALMPCRGFPSQSSLYSASEAMRDAYDREGKPTVVYYLGDHDPSGVLIDPAIRKGLAEHLGDGVPYTVQRLAVLPVQIAAWDLPTRPTKRAGNRHAQGFAGESVELDAIEPDTLRSIVREAIESHFDPAQLEALRRTEQAERETLERLAANGLPVQ
jgi:hypothetical protein